MHAVKYEAAVYKADTAIHVHALELSEFFAFQICDQLKYSVEVGYEPEVVFWVTVVSPQERTSVYFFHERPTCVI